MILRDLSTLRPHHGLLAMVPLWVGCAGAPAAPVEAPRLPAAEAENPPAAEAEDPMEFASIARSECTVLVEGEEIVISLPESLGTLALHGVSCTREGAQHAGALELQVELAKLETDDEFAARVLGGEVVEPNTGPGSPYHVLRLAPEGVRDRHLEAAIWDVKVGKLELRVGAFYDASWSDTPADVQALLRQVEVRRR